jgi:threonine/homoserine/homoserine lactone efflux protein
LAGGFRAGLAVQLGAVIADVVYALLALAGLGLLLTHVGAHLWLEIAGTGFLVYLGWSALNSSEGKAYAVTCPVAEAAPRARPVLPASHEHFRTGFVMGLFNPYGLAFWLSVTGGTMQSPYRIGMMFPGFFLLCLLWSLAFALLVSRWRSRITPRFVRWLSCACGLALVAFGLSLGYSTVLAWPY